MAHTQGIRRRREDSSSLEIEELDSCTMRQNSYNYFQHHRTGSGLLQTSTFRSSLRRGPASQKRQRTLAEQLEDLCLQGSHSHRVYSKQGRRSSEPRVANDKTGGEPSLIEVDEISRENASIIDNSGSDSDGMMDVMGKSAGLQVYGDTAKGAGLRTFFDVDNGKRHRPMDRMYRHYVAVATKSALTETHTLQDNQIVIYRPSVSVKTPLAHDLPAYLSLTPQEFERLSMAEKRQWYQAHSKYMRELHQSAAEQKDGRKVETEMEAKPLESGVGPSGSQSSAVNKRWLYPGKGENFADDVEMMDDDTVPKRPHAAGALTHTQWFTGEDL